MAPTLKHEEDRVGSDSGARVARGKGLIKMDYSSSSSRGSSECGSFGMASSTNSTSTSTSTSSSTGTENRTQPSNEDLAWRKHIEDQLQRPRSR